MIFLSIKYAFALYEEDPCKIVHKKYKQFGDQFHEFGGDTL